MNIDDNKIFCELHETCSGPDYGSYIDGYFANRHNIANILDGEIPYNYIGKDLSFLDNVFTEIDCDEFYTKLGKLLINSRCSLKNIITFIRNERTFDCISALIKLKGLDKIIYVDTLIENEKNNFLNKYRKTKQLSNTVNIHKHLWIIHNVTTQASLTSSINPIYANEKSWYGAYYKDE